MIFIIIIFDNKKALFISIFFIKFIFLKKELFNIKYNKTNKKDIKLNILYNERIPQGEYFVIDENGDALGVLEKDKIFKISEEKNIDVVMINPNSNPKVVRLMNYSQFRYKHQKKLKEIKKKQSVTIVKEIRMSPTIDDNDLNIKIKKAYNFLKQGDKVKIIMRFKGRMITQSNFLGKSIFDKIISNLKDVGSCDIVPKMVSNQMFTFLSPKKIK
ncbi:Translation initiation factor 3 [Candidatus Phytoplasma rubi]|uniref:Translation initiation factor IF-3 n=1 Tax=Candidatus Phytoplasma rubi TaxID=399025 RepID=A0ABY7BU85_9MOLU|nr:translation initiation factor IF-3 [Candidatus Phytoplasma rubi]WAN63646.1 Translation initiation factor 3 [Candidatus Phytoplasma rubi]